MLLAQPRDVLAERVELAGGLRRRPGAPEDPRGGPVCAPIGHLEHLAGESLVDRERVGGFVGFPALREPQPQV